MIGHVLPDDQQALLDTWLPGAAVVRDHSWALGLRRVLELDHEGSRYVLKAGGPDDGHMEREIRAHRSWLAPWTSRGLAPQAVAHDVDHRMLLTHWLPGSLVEGSASADAPDTFRQAGALLRLLHDQPGAVDESYERHETDRARWWLDQDHRIAPAVEGRLRAVVDSWDVSASTALVPTHGDWQPRNWLVDEGRVRVIDLGRADLRPAATDLARLDAQDFGRDPALEEAFLEGYGSDPRSPGLWLRTRLREAISTTVWAFRVGDEAFEQQGHRRIAEALADC